MKDILTYQEESKKERETERERQRETETQIQREREQRAREREIMMIIKKNTYTHFFNLLNFSCNSWNPQNSEFIR